MTVQSRTAAETYRCPKCKGVLSFVTGSWGCTDCRYVPPHGAD
jgi:ribosomal protein L37AE/L43A